MKISILGCGPAGLLAKHAAETAGISAEVFALNPRQSPMPGAQFLHEPIPGITSGNPDGIVNNNLIGEHRGYRKKVYGDLKFPKAWNVTSAEVAPATQPAWDLRVAYHALWNLYGADVRDTKEPIDCDWVDGHYDGCDWMVSTIPLPGICIKGHHFAGVQVNIGADYFFGQSFGVGPFVNSVVCNGEENPSWYRTSQVFGASHTEWPGDIKPPLENIVQVTKPLYHQCDCYDASHVIPLGRYGAWRKGILVNDVYKEVLNNLA